MCHTRLNIISHSGLTSLFHNIESVSVLWGTWTMNAFFVLQLVFNTLTKAYKWLQSLLSVFCSAGNKTHIKSSRSLANHHPASSRHYSKHYTGHTRSQTQPQCSSHSCTLAARAVFVSHHHNNCLTEHLKKGKSQSEFLSLSLTWDGESSGRRFLAACQYGVHELAAGL